MPEFGITHVSVGPETIVVREDGFRDTWVWFGASGSSDAAPGTLRLRAALIDILPNQPETSLRSGDPVIAPAAESSMDREYRLPWFRHRTLSSFRSGDAFAGLKSAGTDCFTDT